MVSLTLEQEKSLREYIQKSSLEDAVKTIYSTRKPRELTGKDGIIMRIFGEDFEGPQKYQSMYFDRRRNEKVLTEFAEFMEAVQIYDTNPSQENKAELLLEAADFLFQKEVVRMRHANHPLYNKSLSQMSRAFDYVIEQLNSRGVSANVAYNAAIIKYGARAWLGVHGMTAKDKDLERNLLLEQIQ
ncbi:MAG: hypothetical protein AABX73_01220 [Nanoarchaeota archaeon]